MNFGQQTNSRVPGGKFWIENELVDKYLSILSGNEFKTLLAITRHYNKNGTCYPSIRRLAVLIDLDPDTVAKSLRALELHGFFQQLEIRERCKLRYVFSKTAAKLLVEPNKLPEKPRSKEVFKEVLKEERLESTERTPEEQERIRQSLESLRARVVRNTSMNGTI